MQRPSGVLIEHDMNDLLLCSPDQIGFKSDRTHSSSARTPKYLNDGSLEAAMDQSIPSKTVQGNPCASVNSPSGRLKEHEIPSVPVTCVQPHSSSAPGENSSDHTGNGAGFETFSM